MTAVAICTDSSALFPAAVAERLGVTVVPIAITLDGAPFEERDDAIEDFYTRLTAGAQVTTSQPSPAALLAAYADAAASGASEVLSIHLDGRASGTVGAAELAARDAPIPVTVVDTRTVSFGVGVCVRAAAEAIAAGASTDDAVARVARVGATLKNVFVAYAGPRGRLPVASGWSLLEFAHGKVEQGAACDALSEAIEAMAARLFQEEGPLRVGVGHAAASIQPAADALARSLASMSHVLEVARYRVGAAVGAHTGGLSFGVFWWPSLSAVSERQRLRLVRPIEASEVDSAPGADDPFLVTRALPQGTVTFLFTDVEGSTQLLHDLGAEPFAEALARHRRVIREACAAHGGVEVGTDGDALFVAFPTASGALEAAGAFSAGLAGGPIRVRTGLHSGIPLIAEDNYVGLDVNLAARIAASGHGGQIVLSKTTRDLLDDRFVLTDLGEHRLKDIADPVWIFQLGGERFPPLKTISNTNVPRPVSSFVGRERELEKLVTRIRDGARLVSLTGAGGSGKTRLAIETAFELVEAFPSGVFWVGLASLRDPTVVLEAISQTLGAKDELATHIADRKMLLLLDNLEQVIEAAPELSALLVSCPNLSMLVTSRELLRVQGELEYQVPPLANTEAVELFCARARIEPSDTVAELCARLDNQPLAVELAAARITLLTPEQILERLSQRLDFLQGGRDADPRQQTLRATIEWSHELLSPAEQQLFARLSVFAGSFDLEAADAVSDGDLDDLQLLIDKSLLRRTEEGRFFMLETIREYALERLEQSRDAATSRNAHTLHFLALAEAASSELQGSEQLEWLGRLETEHDNMRAALEWALAPAGPPDRAELGLRLAGALGRFWYIRAHALEGSAWLERAIAAAGEHNHLRAKALQALGTLLDQRGDRSRAMEVLEESVRLYKAAGDTVRITAALNSLGIVARNQGDLRRARAYLTESLELRRELGDRAAVSTTTCDLGLVAFDEGGVDEARALFEQSLALDRELGDRGGEAINLNNLGAVALAQGDLAAAARLLGGGLRAFSEVGDREGVAEALELAACVASRRGQGADAARLAGAAGALRRAIGIPIASDADQSRLDRELEATRESLGDSEIASAWAAGEALSEEAAVAAALSLLDEPARVSGSQ